MGYNTNRPLQVTAVGYRRLDDFILKFYVIHLVEFALIGQFAVLNIATSFAVESFFFGGSLVAMLRRICFTTVLLLGVLRGSDRTAVASPPNPIAAVSFSYEGSIRLSSSPVYANGKTDYSWGEVQSVGSQVRHYRQSVMRSGSDDPNRYKTTEFESYHVGDDTLLCCQRSIDIQAMSPLASLKDAMALYSQRADGSLSTSRYFKSGEGSAQNNLLQGMSFLGITNDGPLSVVGTDSTGQFDGRDLYVYRSSDGADHRYEYDPDVRLYTRYSIASESSSTAQNAYHIEGRLIDGAAGGDGFVFRNIITHENNGASPLVVTIEQRVFDVRFDDIAPVEMKLVPHEGERIDSTSTPHIRYEWRDGRIAKRVDEILDSEVEYGVAPSRFRWLLGVNLFVVLVILVEIYFRKKRRTLLGIAAMTLLSMPCDASASNPYCGVYSVALAGRSMGLSVDIEAMIDPAYISSHRGSTGQDLIEAAESIGLKGTLLSGLGIYSLYAGDSPLILHAAPMGSHAIYQHWILFLGFDETGSARVIDGIGGVATCSIEEVLARWDGIAVAVRKPEAPSARYLSAELSGLLGLISISGVFSLLLRSAMPDMKRSVAGAISSGSIVLVLLLAVSAGVGYATRGEGFDNAVAGIDFAMRLREPETISRDEVVEQLKVGAILIDCRYADDYGHGTIDGAISLPVNVGLGEFEMTLAALDRKANVIVFCQSRNCGFSAYTSTMLAGAGFQQVAVYKGGYEEWRSHDNGQ